MTMSLCSLNKLFTARNGLLGAVFFFIVLVLQWRRLTRPQKWYYYPSPCSQPADVVDDSAELAVKIHGILSTAEIAHVLCYGSLWGALRREDMLPWDRDVDICLWGEDMDKIEKGYFYGLFKSEGIPLSYDDTKGVYTATHKKAKADIIVFKMSDDFIWLERVSVLNKALNPEKEVRFPSKLIAPPLPTLAFHGYLLPVPRGGNEMQKYIYPEDWWKEVKPPNC